MGIAGDYKSVVMPFIFGGRTRSLSTIALAVVLCVMGGCGNRSIIGKWRMSGASDAMVWEFSNNGSVLVGDVRGRYKFGDQERIGGSLLRLQQIHITEDRFGRVRAQGPGLFEGVAGLLGHSRLFRFTGGMFHAPGINSTDGTA